MAHPPRVGISGWSYAPWRKTFYPDGLAQKHELEFASRQVNSIEINGAFYSLPKPEHFKAWAAAVPDDFVFAVKGNRFITHNQKLKNVEEPIRNFFASGLLALGAKLGPILWQFPPGMAFNPERFEAFLKYLPRDFSAAAKLARAAGPFMKGRAFAPKRVAINHRIRHAVEVRHDSFNDAAFAKLLKQYGVALVTADAAGKWPYFEIPTADFVYVRLHGEVEMYASGYTAAARARWAAKIKSWSRTRDVFAYFDNDVKVRAPFDAVDLLKLLIKDYAPQSPMDRAKVANLRTPGPRLQGEDPRWRRHKTASK